MDLGPWTMHLSSLTLHGKRVSWTLHTGKAFTKRGPPDKGRPPSLKSTSTEVPKGPSAPSLVKLRTAALRLHGGGLNHQRGKWYESERESGYPGKGGWRRRETGKKGCKPLTFTSKLRKKYEVPICPLPPRLHSLPHHQHRPRPRSGTFLTNHKPTLTLCYQPKPLFYTSARLGVVHPMGFDRCKSRVPTSTVPYRTVSLP